MDLGKDDGSVNFSIAATTDFGPVAIDTRDLVIQVDPVSEAINKR
jgi:hypothetical protein